MLAMGFGDTPDGLTSLWKSSFFHPFRSLVSFQFIHSSAVRISTWPFRNLFGNSFASVFSVLPQPQIEQDFWADVERSSVGFARIKLNKIYVHACAYFKVNSQSLSTEKHVFGLQRFVLFFCFSKIRESLNWLFSKLWIEILPFLQVHHKDRVLRK